MATAHLFLSIAPLSVSSHHLKTASTAFLPSKTAAALSRRSISCLKYVRAAADAQPPPPPAESLEVIGETLLLGSNEGPAIGSLDIVQVKINVGPVGSLKEQTFSFKRKLGASSDIVVVTLEKPLGIIFEQSKTGVKGRGRAFVAELVTGGKADRISRVAQLFEGKQKRVNNCGRLIIGGSVKPGDVLRATTMVNVVVDLLGLRAPQRVVLFFEADGKKWSETMAAIQSSFVADGPVTLVLERENC